MTGLGNISGVPNEAFQVELAFPDPKSEIKNLRTGEKIANGKSISIEWKPWEALLLETDRNL